jgi:hypothetical protein
MTMRITLSDRNSIRFTSILADSPGYTVNDIFEIMIDCLEKHQDSDYPLENKKEGF